MAEKIDYSKGIYDAKQLGTPKLLSSAHSTCLQCSAQPCWCPC